MVLDKIYNTTKDMSLIQTEILRVYPSLRGSTHEMGFEDPAILVEGNGRMIHIVITEPLIGETEIDSIINNFVPVRPPRRSVTERELLQEIADNEELDLV